ncbi:molecular chaperone, partial [Spiromyces aspiralis]
AKYLLELQDREVKEADSLTDAELLMEVLEMREALEECKNEEQLAELRVKNNANVDRVIKALTEAFRNRDYGAAQGLTIQLQYWDNLRQAIHHWTPGKPSFINH